MERDVGIFLLNSVVYLYVPVPVRDKFLCILYVKIFQFVSTVKGLTGMIMV